MILLPLLLCLPPRPAAPAADPAPGAPGSPRERVERRLGAMGTSFELEVEAATRAEALAASEAAVRAVEAVAERLSTWTDDSELAALNRAPLGERLELSEALARDLVRARDAWLWSDGAFDPAVGRLVETWGLRAGGRDDAPSPAELAAAVVPGGLSALELGRDARGPFAVRRHEALAIEEGGFGKGVGLDAGLAALREAGATGALLDLGGQVARLASDGAPPVELEIADPRDRARGVVRVRLASGSFATSGNSERAIEVAGERVGHLLDPRTGRPAPDFGSVTAFAEDATTADLLSTAFFVLGPEVALERAARTTGVDVLVLDVRAGRLRARATSGLADRLVATASSGLAIEWHDASSSRSPSPSDPLPDRR